MNQEFADLRAYLNSNYFERQDIIDGLLVALISKQSMFLLGTPGTAKSAIAEEACSAIGGSYFSWLLSKFSKPEELFGPIDLKALEQGIFRHETSGKLPEAKIALIDECFKASSAILNTLLSIINERKFYNGKQSQNCPLETLICASNEIPENGELAAFFDRLVLKFEAKNLQSDNSLRSLLRLPSNSQKSVPHISPKTLAEAQSQAANLAVGDDIIDLIIQIKRQVSQVGITVSERKLRQSLSCCQAQAYLAGHSKVEAEDLEILKNILWARIDQRKAVAKIVHKVANPIGEQIQDIVDGIDEIVELLNTKKTQAFEAQTKVVKAIETLESLSKSSQSQKLVDALQYAKSTNLWICRDHLKIRV